ncbi:MAG: amidohydrolase family protein [Rhizobiaceae bacterium]|nr:amidohydrolase family protein [Rhizobiaceae bacterium]
MAKSLSAVERSNRDRRLAVALKREPADKVLSDVKVLDVHGGTFFEGGIAIVGNRIAFVGDVDDLIGPDTQVIDGKGRIAIPGLIDGHIHTYESHLPISEVARGFFRHGVTSIITDFYGEAVVRGMDAIRASLREAEPTGLNTVFVLPMPALYQDEPFVHTGTIDLAAMEEMAAWDECHGLNECFVKFLTGGEPRMVRLVDAVQSHGGKVCGHGSEASENEVQAWGGWVRRLDDHEAISGEEALSRIRAGIHVIAREGSGVSDVRNILSYLVEKNADLRRVSFCTDILSPVDLLSRGSIDYCVRIAMEEGVSPVAAIQMATINSAECHQIDDDVGALAPGRRADIILLDGPIEQFHIGTVIAAGEIVAKEGRDIKDRAAVKRPDFAYNTVSIGAISSESFSVKVPSGTNGVLVRVIGVGDGTIVTRSLERRLPVKDGLAQPLLEGGINLVAAIDRHAGDPGKLGVGFVEGFNLIRGAMASTYNPHYQHLLVVGANAEDMAVAARACAEQGGGFVVVDDGKVTARVPLPLYGLLSEESIDTLGEQIAAAFAALRELGCPLETPFHTLAFTGLPISIGRLKINSRGLVDVWRGETVPVLIDESGGARS